MSRRSRFGCQTCKIRKVKCDETLPDCKQCTSTGRRCDGPSKNKSIFVASAPSGQRRAPLSKNRSSVSCVEPRLVQPSSVPELREPDRRALSFFIQRAGPALAGEPEEDFWHASVLQLCHHNPMVRDAVLAVSTLYEKPLTNPLSWPTSVNANFSQPQHRQAFKWYSQSLNGMSEMLYRPQNQEQLHLALTSCILFASIEAQQLNVANSMQLMKCGYSLLSQATNRAPVTNSPLIRNVLLPIFLRQTLVMLLQGYSLPEGWLSPDLIALDKSSPLIVSLQDARTHLFMLMLDGFVVMKEAYLNLDSSTVTSLQNAKSTIMANLQTWRQHFDAYLSKRDELTSSSSQNRAIHLLQIYYCVAVIWLPACLSPGEMIYDSFTTEFTTILDHTEAILSDGDLSDVAYTFEMGIIPPLYFVGWRCRVPQIRRRALQLLRRAPAQESLFHREVVIFALRGIIGVEENVVNGVDVESVDGKVPAEDARLRYAMVRWDSDAVKSGHIHGDGKPFLVYSKWALMEDENGHLRELSKP